MIDDMVGARPPDPIHRVGPRGRGDNLEASDRLPAGAVPASTALGTLVLVIELV